MNLANQEIIVLWLWIKQYRLSSFVWLCTTVLSCYDMIDLIQKTNKRQPQVLTHNSKIWEPSHEFKIMIHILALQLTCCMRYNIINAFNKSKTLGKENVRKFQVWMKCSLLVRAMFYESISISVHQPMWRFFCTFFRKKQLSVKYCMSWFLFTTHENFFFSYQVA